MKKNYKSNSIFKFTNILLIIITSILLFYYSKFRKIDIILEKVIKMEPENILAWHLKGIIHNSLGEFLEADLSAAEEFLRRRDFKMASYFANKVIIN